MCRSVVHLLRCSFTQYRPPGSRQSNLFNAASYTINFPFYPSRASTVSTRVKKNVDDLLHSPTLQYSSDYPSISSVAPFFSHIYHRGLRLPNLVQCNVQSKLRNINVATSRTTRACEALACRRSPRYAEAGPGSRRSTGDGS